MPVVAGLLSVMQWTCVAVLCDILTGTPASSRCSDAFVRSLVEQGAVLPLCALLEFDDENDYMLSLSHAIQALEQILHVGSGCGEVSYATAVEECGGLDALRRVAREYEVGEEIPDLALQLLNKHFADRSGMEDFISAAVVEELGGGYFIDSNGRQGRRFGESTH